MELERSANIGALSMTDKAFMENIKNVYRKISSAAIRSGRSPFDVQLVAVTKTIGMERIRKAIDLGLRVFGENRVQEAKEKIEGLREQVQNATVEWHLIGHLQKNKAKVAVGLFNLIHSLDSIDLAREINRHAEKEGKMQRVLVQVKLSEEEAKHGIAPEDFISLIGSVQEMHNLKLEGLMTIPPFFDDPGAARPYFRMLRELRDKAEDQGVRLPQLSMGMSGDFEVAILEGATMVRIGTSIFGERR